LNHTTNNPATILMIQCCQALDTFQSSNMSQIKKNHISLPCVVNQSVHLKTTPPTCNQKKNGSDAHI
jgi:hypothetical protein